MFLFIKMVFVWDGAGLTAFTLMMLLSRNYDFIITITSTNAIMLAIIIYLMNKINCLKMHYLWLTSSNEYAGNNS